MLLNMIYIMGAISIGYITWGIISNFDEINMYINNKIDRIQKMNEIRKQSIKYSNGPVAQLVRAVHS